MSLKLSINVWHRCGTCGSIFRTLDELSAHVEAEHSEDSASFDYEANYPVSLPGGRYLRSQVTDLPHAR